MRRVLMISPHFPPDTSAGAHRVRLLAPHLPASGWVPTVLTVTPDAYEGPLDPGLAALVPSTLDVRRAPAWPASATRRVGLGDLGLRSLRGLGRLAGELLASDAFDALFITIYPTYPALLGPRLKRRFGVPFVLDYQDPWVGSWGLDTGPGGRPDLRSRLSRAVAARLEPRVVVAADALTAVSARTYEDVLARIPAAHPRVCEPIPIGYDLADGEAAMRAGRPNPLFDPTDGLTHLSYVGTLLPAGFEVLRAVLAALDLLRTRAPGSYARLRLHFFGTSNQRDANAPARVLPEATAAGVADIVSEAPVRLDYLDALRALTDSSAVLLMGSAEPHYTPSKVFAALLSGRPLLAVHHADSPVSGPLAAHPGAAAFTFADGATLRALTPALAAALERLIEAPRPAHVAIPAVFHPWAASALAARLASVLDRVA